MSADFAPAGPAGRVTASRPAGGVIARQSARSTVGSAVLWGYVFGVIVASSAVSYDRIYRTAAERQSLAHAMTSDHAVSALFGPARQVQTVAGFTVFKASMTVMIIGAVWGLLTSTRLLRGEEDAGRWEITVSGVTTRRRATAQVLAGLASGAAVVWAITALVTVAVGRASSVRIGVTAGLYLALALVASAVVFLAVGAVTSQLAPSRRQAAGYAAAVLGVSYALRMVADAGAGLHGLIWASPLGWAEELRPLTGPRPWALVPLAALTVVLALLAVFLAGRRDVGTGSWPGRDARAPRLGLLSGPAGLTVRLTGLPSLWWAAATAICGLLMGTVAKAAGSSIAGSSQQVLSRLGAPGTGTGTFLGLAFMIMAIVIAFAAVSQVSAARGEEAAGRLDHLLASPVSRTRWFTGRMAAAAAALVLTGAAAGMFAWLGTAAQPPSGVSIAAALGAGVNTVPSAIFVLGVGALSFGCWPRRATTVAYVVLGWSAVIELAGGFFAQNHWVLDTSLFHQMASAPAVAPDWQVNGVLAGLGLAAMIAGGAAFGRRDLRGE